MERLACEALQAIDGDLASEALVEPAHLGEHGIDVGELACEALQAIADRDLASEALVELHGEHGIDVAELACEALAELQQT